MNENYKNMSNSEIKFEMINLENKYEKTKSKILLLIAEMKELDEKYISAKNELNNRSKGLF